jgi:uncharacterized protein (TIGR03435 family)
MKRQTWLVVFAVLLSATWSDAQTPVGLSFEVASIKPSAPLDPTKRPEGPVRYVGMEVDKARVDIARMSLADLIGAAYQVKPYQISGPDWMGNQRFDILAKLPDGAATSDVPQMLQNLLAERFKLAIHRELKDQAVYQLMVGKNGAKLKESTPEPPIAESSAADTPPPGTQTAKVDRNGVTSISGGPLSGSRASFGSDGKLHIQANMTMIQLADSLIPLVGRIVIDRTQLAGRYQTELVLSPQDLPAAQRAAGPPPQAGAGGPVEASEPGGSILSALQDMGLRLQPGKQPPDMVVVDRLEKLPTEQ